MWHSVAYGIFEYLKIYIYVLQLILKRFNLVMREVYQMYIMYRDLYFTVIRAWICNMVTSADVRIYRYMYE